MTFDEWFNKTVVTSHREDYRKVYLLCWDAAFQAGRDYQQELDRLAEYDRSVFGN